MSFLVLLFNADFLLLRHRHAWRSEVTRRAWLCMVVESWNIFMSSPFLGKQWCLGALCYLFWRQCFFSSLSQACLAAMGNVETHILNLCSRVCLNTWVEEYSWEPHGKVILLMKGFCTLELKPKYPRRKDHQGCFRHSPAFTAFHRYFKRLHKWKIKSCVFNITQKEKYFT